MRIIAGPCQHESYEQSLQIAHHCADVCSKYEAEYIFKASYDKANRSHISGGRGKGMNETLVTFLEMKQSIPDLKILTDVHTEFQIEDIMDMYDNAVDVLQIPAFLCRQTDLIELACDTDKIVNIKKGQFMAPWDVKGILSKTANAKEAWITERGTSFGYGRLVNDFTGMLDNISYLGKNFVYDVTHSVQLPGSQGTATGGNRDYVPGLCRAGAALGIESFFIEVHPDPDNAPSDGANMLKLDDFEKVINDIDCYSYTR